MALANPRFCGCSLKTAIAIIKMIVSALGFFIRFLFCYVLMVIGINVARELRGEPACFKAPLGWAEIGVGITILVFVLIVFVLIFYLSVTVKLDGDEEDLRKCDSWFIVTAILCVVDVVGLIVMIAVGGVDEAIIWFYLIGAVYNAFSMWVVCEFMNALKSGQLFDTSRTRTAAVYNADEVLKV